MKRTFFHKAQTTNKGYILLLTMLIISILLAMSFGIFAISIKEVILSSFLKDSQRAFAAADRAAECALYWDRGAPANGMPYTIFSTSTDYVLPAAVNTAICDGVPLTSANWDNSVVGTTLFTLHFPDLTCATVSVVSDGVISTLTSNGFSGDCASTDPRITERTIEVTSNF